METFIIDTQVIFLHPLHIIGYILNIFESECLTFWCLSSKNNTSFFYLSWLSNRVFLLQMNVSTVLHLMAERSHVQCHEKWGLVEYLPELNIERSKFLFSSLYENVNSLS